MMDELASNDRQYSESRNQLEIRDSNHNRLTEKLGGHITSSLIAIAISRLLSFLLLKILAIVLAKPEFGLYNLWFSFTMLLQALAVSSSTATIWRYLQAESFSPDERSRLLSTAAYASIALCAVGPLFLGIAYLTFGYAIADDAFYVGSLVVSSVLAVSYAVQELVRSVSGTEQNSREILLFNTTFSIGTFLGGIALTLAFNDFRMTMLGMFLGLIIPSGVALFYKAREYGWCRPSWLTFKFSMSFGSSLTVVTVVASAVAFVISFFVGIFQGLEGIGVLGVALTAGSALKFVFNAPLSAYNAFIVKSYETDQLEEGDKVTIKIVEFFVTVSTVAFILIFSAAPLVVLLISTEAYLDATLLLPFAIASTILLALSAIWRFRLFLIEKSHLVTVAHSMSLVVLVFSCLLAVPSLGLLGAGIALLLQSVTVLALIVSFAQENLGIPIPRAFLAKWLLALACLIIVYWFLSYVGVGNLSSGAVASVVFLMLMIITRAHRLKDIKRLILLLLQPLR
jgi:O-antigen/teichoic acid export membrane protein